MEAAPGPAAPAGPLMEKLGMEWLEATPDRLSARIPVEGNTQPFGLLHGGASAALAETVFRLYDRYGRTLERMRRET